MTPVTPDDCVPVAPASTYPDGFHELPQEKRDEFFAKRAALYAAKQKREAAAEALLAELVRTRKDPKAGGKQQATAKVVPFDPKATKPSPLKLEHWCDLPPPTGEEWLVKGLVPKQGVGTLFGASGAFKSFGAIDLAWHIAAGARWAGRRVNAAPVVYLAVEGSAGVRKRLNGARKQHGRSDARDPLYMVAAALNLGAGPEDAARMISSIEAIDVKPGLVVVDTLSASLAGADENGQGMGAFLGNCQRIALRFDCLVIAVHHTGWGENAGRRERGHSSLPANVDLRILCEKVEDQKAAWTFEKIKDGPSGQVLKLTLEEVEFGLDRDGDPITTLAVMSAEQVDAEPKQTKKVSVPPQERLLMATVELALIEAGQDFRIPEGPAVKAVTEEAIRSRYYARIAEKPLPDETPEKLVQRQRQAFHRSLNAAVKAMRIIATERGGERIVWLP
jgi:hypothetical protein